MTGIGLMARALLTSLRLGPVAAVALAVAFAAIGCSKNEAAQVGAGSEGRAGPGNPDAGRDGGNAGGDAGLNVSSVIVSAATPKPRKTTWSVNYWAWMPSLGDDVSGTEVQVARLKPAILRIGGYNNDVNFPDAFNNAELDKAVMYAHAIGAEPLIQVPLLADIDGNPPTAVTAAAIVTYANVTQGYGIQYFSIGNEPDLYESVGSRNDYTLPALPNFQPSDYCAAARAYVTAMKAVDPSIKIIGPDLSWQYVTGSDWLTPILQNCGDLFDIVSIHRLPFNSAQTTLEAAMGDATQFDNVLTSVRASMQAAGAGDKPLAVMEMGIAYTATACEHSASPGTTGSALWLADGLGTAINHDLWTCAVWNISDDDTWSLGLVGPSAHVPRPAYYTYQLYADHFGPTLIDVSQQPQGIRTYASRNRANDATELIVVNWSTSSAPLSFQVTGLPTTPVPATYTLPDLSINAVEIPDNGASVAWTYGEAQRLSNQGIVALAPGASAAIDWGPPQVDNACEVDASVTCQTVVLTNKSITTGGENGTTGLVFTPASYQWRSFSYAGSGQSAPAATVTPDGNGIQFTGGLVPPVSDNWSGLGLYFDSLKCIDGSNYTGVKFDFSGDLGGCSLVFGVNFSGDSSSADNPQRGDCSLGDANCYPPRSIAIPPSVSGSADAGPTTLRFPFALLTGGSPNAKIDPTTIMTVEWELSAPSGGVGCSANFTVENVAFY